MVFPIKKIRIKLKQFVSPKNIALRLLKRIVLIY